MAGTGDAAKRAFLQLSAAFDAKLSVAAGHLGAADRHNSRSLASQQHIFVKFDENNTGKAAA